MNRCPLRKDHQDRLTIQPQFFFNKGSGITFLTDDPKKTKNCLSISKLKAARYIDFGLEELVSSLWVESERDYDISAAYVSQTRLVVHDRNGILHHKHSEPTRLVKQSDPNPNSSVLSAMSRRSKKRRIQLLERRDNSFAELNYKRVQDLEKGF
ncbi:hypothetical protein Tco_0469452 [Tanacetum coccineum]